MVQKLIIREEALKGTGVAKVDVEVCSVVEDVEDDVLKIDDELIEVDVLVVELSVDDNEEIVDGVLIGTVLEIVVVVIDGVFDGGVKVGAKVKLSRGSTLKLRLL